jgi:co-chaperonin GroES (HSP10)
MINYEEMAKGKKSLQIRAYTGDIKPLYDRVLVRDMHFGDTTTNGGIIVLSDDGKDRGIKPRWGRVVRKGEDNKDEYGAGDWILVEHGRWTRGFDVEFAEDDVANCRIVEAESVLLWSDEKPQDILFGDKTGADDTPAHRPEDFAGKY